MTDLSQVFISYSQESDEHIKRVRDFANRLRQRGIEVVLDQDCDSPLEE